MMKIKKTERKEDCTRDPQVTKMFGFFFLLGNNQPKPHRQLAKGNARRFKKMRD